MQVSPRTVGICSSIQQTESKQATKGPKSDWQNKSSALTGQEFSLIGTLSFRATWSIKIIGLLAEHT